MHMHATVAVINLAKTGKERLPAKQRKFKMHSNRVNYIYACIETKRAYLVQGRSWCSGIYFQAQPGYWLKPVTGSGAGMKLVLRDEASGWRRPR